MPTPLRMSPARPLLALSLFCLFASHSARAHWQCPAGVDPFGPNTSGVACYWVDAPEQDSGGDAGEYEVAGDDDYGYGPPPPPMRHNSPEEWQAFMEAARQSAEQAARDAGAPPPRMRAPIQRALEDGTWDFAENAPDQSPHYCAASFLTLQGGVLLMTISGKDGGSVLGYFGGAIPGVKGEPETVTLSLTQSGQTQTVRALHTRFPLARSMGMYLFAVPSTDALLDAIEDEQDYTVVHKGETAISGQWQGGLKARHWLRACASR